MVSQLEWCVGPAGTILEPHFTGVLGPRSYTAGMKIFSEHLLLHGRRNFDQDMSPTVELPTLQFATVLNNSKTMLFNINYIIFNYRTKAPQFEADFYTLRNKITAHITPALLALRALGAGISGYWRLRKIF